MKFSEYIKQNSTNESNKKQSLKFSEWVNQYVTEQEQQAAEKKAQQEAEKLWTDLTTPVYTSTVDLKPNADLNFKPIWVEGSSQIKAPNAVVVSQEAYDTIMQERQRLNTNNKLKTAMDTAKTEWENARDSTITEKVMNFFGGIEGKSDKEIAKEKYLSAAEAYYQNLYNTDADLTIIFNSLQQQKKETTDETVKAELDKDTDKIGKLLYGNTAIDDYLGSNVMAGLGGISGGITATLDATAGNLLKLFGWENNPISLWNNSVQSSLSYWSERSNNAGVAIGDNRNVGGRFLQALVGIIPDAVLAYMSRGASLASSNTLKAIAGTGIKASTANLVRTTAQLEGKLSPIVSIASKSKVVADAAATALKTTAKNPMYWTSFTRTFGTDYAAAKEKGADEVAAYIYAFVTSTMNSLVEVGGGIQVLPARLQNKTKSQILDWIKSALEEGREEVVQSIISEMNKKLMYDYDKEIFSPTNEDAILNPGRLAGEFAMGTAVGAVAGGGQVIASNVSTAKYTKLGKSVRNSVNIGDLLSYAQKSSNENIRTIARENTAEKISNKDLGILYGYAVRDVDAAFNSVSDIEGVNRVLGELASENLPESVNMIAFSRWVARLDTIDPQTVSGYNNSRVNNDGGSNDVGHQSGEISGSNSQRAGADTGTESEGRRARTENERDFTRRITGASQKGKRRIRRIGETLFAYTPKEADSSQASKAVEILNKAGISAVYCEGYTESNSDGVTIFHNMAVTVPDGTIYVSDNAVLNAIQTAAHEAVHFHQKQNSQAYIEYESVLCQNILWGSKEYATVAREIFEKYHRSGIEKKKERKLTDEEINDLIYSPEYVSLFLTEFTACVNQAISGNATNTMEKFGSMFSNWDAVVEASRKFNEAIGLDFSGTDPDTTTAPGEGADTDTRTDGESVGSGITELSAADIKKDAFKLAMEDVIGYKELSEEQKTIRDIGRQLGWKVVFAPVRTPKGSKADGKISFATKTITIDPTSKKPIQFILKHELAHSLEQNKEAYTELQNAIMDSQAFKDYVKAQGFASTSAYNADIVARYKAEGVEGFDSTKAEYKANCEMVANFVGDCLFGGNTEVTARLLEGMNTTQRRSFTEWVKDFFAKIRAKLTGKHQQLTDEISRLEQVFLKTLNSVEAKENTATQDGESYSIATDSKNRKVVVLDRNIFNGVVDLKARAEALEDWIINNFGGTKHNTSDYFFVVMNERTAGKMKFWNENMDAVAYERKLSAAEHIDELIKISKFDRYSKNVKDKHKAFANKGWNYFKSYFTDGKRVYEADISVAKSNEQSVVYNIGYIKDVGQYEPNNKSSYSLTGSPNESVTIPENEASNRNSTDRIPQKEVSVNSNSMQESDKYSISTEYSLKNVLEQVEKGEISAKEAETLLSRKKTLSPAEIANMKEEDANTTPKIKRRQGENRGDRESKFYKSLMGSSIFDDTFKQEAADDSFIQKYQSVTNAETLKKAAEALDEGGEEYVKRWNNIKPEEASLIDAAVGFILMDRYQRVGDYQSAIAAAEKVKAFGTAGGQKIQLYSILSRLDPNTMVIYAQRELTSAFNILQKKRTQKWIDQNAARFNLNEEEIEFIRRRTLQAAQLPEGRDKARLLAEIAALLQDKLPPERGQGMKALQRISMLLTPKTNERNILGNAGMVPVFITSDFFGSGIDRIVSKRTGVRTTGMFDPKAVKGFVKGTFETMDDFRRHINTRNEELNRFETGKINTSGKAFNDQHTGRLAKQLNDCAKVLNALDRFTSFCLELGDRPFYEMWYVNSINNQLKLNKTNEATPEMIQIACLEALQRTWQDTNKLVKVVTNAKDALNVLNVAGYGLGDVMVKFVKTPANLTKAIVDFSPAGVVKAIAVDAKNLRNAIEKGQYEASLQKKFVDSLSKGIAGSMLYVLAAALASAGMLSGAGDDDKDVSNFEKYIQGIPEYSIKLFGKWWSYDWMQPIGAVFATVADYMKTREENPDSTMYEDIIEAIRAGGEVLYNQSFMQSIQMLFTADNPIDGVIEALFNDPSAFIPQFVSQIANVTDDYRRVTYEAGKPFETAMNKVKLKIPGLRQTLEKQVDVLGRDVPNSQNNVFNAFFNPGNTYTDTSNAVTDEVYALFKRTGELSVIPRKAPYSITKAGITRQLTAEQTNDYQRLAGNTSAELLEVIFDSADYAELDDVQKVDLVTKVYDYAAKYAKAQLDIYDYELLSAIEGTDKNGDPILSESLYNRLDEKAKQILIDEAFYSKAELKCKGDTEKLVKLFMKQVRE